MTTLQKIIKYLAIALALFLTVSIIEGLLGIVGVIGGLMDREPTVKETETYTVTTDIDRLEIEIGAADFKIEQAAEFSVKSNLKNLTVKEQNGKLIIKETNHLSVRTEKTFLTLSIPSGKTFERVELTTGAGRLTVEHLSADTLKLVLGAGEATVNELNATTAADISGGAGRITISGGALHNLDLEMGVGELNLTSALTGDCELELGVGQSNITVLGDKEAYRLDLQKGLGSLTVDGVNISNSLALSGGRHSLTVHGGVGAIYVDFAKSAKY